jgi:hypothetical protein
VVVAAAVAAWTISCHRCSEVVACANRDNLKVRRRESQFSTH